MIIGAPRTSSRREPLRGGAENLAEVLGGARFSAPPRRGSQREEVLGAPIIIYWCY